MSRRTRAMARQGYCPHGVYVGGCGIDWMCGKCEDGWTERMDKDAAGRHRPRFLIHVPGRENPIEARDSRFAMMMLKIARENGADGWYVRKEVFYRGRWMEWTVGKGATR